MQSPNHVASSQKKYYRSGTTLFLSFFRRSPGLLLATLMGMGLSAIATMLPAIFTGRAIDILKVDGFTQEFILTTGFIVLAGVFFYVITFLTMYSFVTLAFRFERDIRQEYFDRIQAHSLTFHDENNSSKLLSMGMTEISQMRMGIMPALRAILSNIFSLIFIISAITTITDTSKGAIALFGFVLYYILAIYQARRIIPVRTELANTIGELTEQSQEIFQGIEVVRSLKSSIREMQKFNVLSQKYSDLGKREGRMAAFYLPNLALLSMTALLFWLSLIDVTTGILTVGDLITVLGLLLTIQLSSMMMPQMFLLLNAALTNSNRIWEKMNWEDPVPDKEIDIAPDVNWEADIVFDDVSFSYTNDNRFALKNIDLTIPARSKVALIGGPGSGKSTFLKLLLQLYVPTEGRILVEDVDYRDIPTELIRQNVSRVEQEIFLFSGRIRNNIAFAKPEATSEDIIKAAEAAQALEFIDQLPDGIDTVIGERGVDLSGGQKQRLAIARAILADPKILLLDDSASALDSRTEELLREALNNLSADRLTITVTQRLNTLVSADLIILLHRGRVLATGNHRELLSNCVEYRKIFELLPESEKILAAGGVN